MKDGSASTGPPEKGHLINGVTTALKRSSASISGAMVWAKYRGRYLAQLLRFPQALRTEIPRALVFTLVRPRVNQ
jgi:hypothetical protein